MNFHSKIKATMNIRTCITILLFFSLINNLYYKKKSLDKKLQ